MSHAGSGGHARNRGLAIAGQEHLDGRMRKGGLTCHVLDEVSLAGAIQLIAVWLALLNTLIIPC